MASIFSDINKALETLKNGGMIILADNENRENEGDIVTLGETITPETVNFMIGHAKGLLCAPMSPKVAEKLGFRMMVEHSTDPNQTPFTISTDGEYHATGVTTGVSAFDRAATIKRLATADAKPTDFNHPGHVFPLIAKESGLLSRDGHTEASVDLAKLCGKAPVAAIIEVIKTDGHMARRDDLAQDAKEWGLPLITIDQIKTYMHEKLVAASV
ncbi:3,4-dihydroxy-2-butanone-4-phosphate synthase [Lentilactobacillus diolivorans]|uniref:3,4-dihydroxy-2-butanone-4-phosphate synthase n=1 Tax=Lentilactobacillus diolivorans TaxID=179838 RepID=UPI000FF05E86|nr:3,4-dihydroxy-2-butanone-4-phosphate synthase [Lentilactobacillus diolivorans]MDH5104538.1 3,4-dihydroxy-2-butanone-4-phosphate synthase [Lentilactobacillus diolivorans]RRG02719.1 MAG: 3,4-dihydroxy-2-butanone-4-phosphate synthase [Lactobacillus sp.]